MRKKVDLPEVKTWIAAAIKAEEGKSPDQLWKNALTEDDAKEGRLKLAGFLRKHGKYNIEAFHLAERLEVCRPKSRCFSGACPECGRLLQRAWVRESRKLISSLETEGIELVALSLVLPNSAVAQGAFQFFDIKNMQRRLKYRLDDAHIDVAIGAIDFSFNEDEQGKYPGFWCPHVYVITATDNRERLAARLNGFSPSLEIPHPTKVTPFKNTARRRSYAMKMHFGRRIGYDDQRVQNNGKIRSFRNTRPDRLRAIERLELVLFLDQIGFAERAIFRFVKPVIKDRENWEGVYFDRITGSKRNGKS
jgi:hypothetical protein